MDLKTAAERAGASLPIGQVLGAITDALRAGACAVVVAPPGAGKTTVIPLALATEPWATEGKIIVLEPRRLATRAAAARMAWLVGESVGETVGYRVRLESRVSARTRIEVVTEGVFTRMILGDAGLEGVAAVLFDEFHERSLDGDLGLAFARDSQLVLRPDLKLLVMSATLDGAAISRLLGDAPVIESQGRAYEVETRHIDRGRTGRLEDQVAAAIRRALGEESGDVLVFLPGQGEIVRTSEILKREVSDPTVDIRPLYGALESGDQALALIPSVPGRRKVVLATSIAQTSLTIEGVRVVIDAGLTRAPRFDTANGLTRLTTVRVSRAAADQRRGRAGRTMPGVCYRLWNEAETRGLAPTDRPEILETDLARLALDLARWGERDLGRLALLDKPTEASLTRARRFLRGLGALDSDDGLTDHGRVMSGMALPPQLAHMVLTAARRGQARRAARLALLITERGLGGADSDLSRKLDRLVADRSDRGRSALILADRLARQAGPGGEGAPLDDGALLALAFPERVAKSRDGAGGFLLANGRGAVLDPSEALAREAWITVGELGGGVARDRILLAARLDPNSLKGLGGALLRSDQTLVSGPSGLSAVQTLWFGRLALEERRGLTPDPALILATLVEDVRGRGVAALPWGDGSRSLRARVAFLRGFDASWPDLSDAALIERLEEWLTPRLAGQAALSSLKEAPLEAALSELIPWELRGRLDVLAPRRWRAPTGTSIAIDYDAVGGPRVDVRVQELFGLTSHPVVGPGAPLTLALLSPAGRPIQVTADLPGFWRGSWSDVRREMRGRYPKHPWPEDPAAATPTTRATRRV